MKNNNINTILLILSQKNIKIQSDTFQNIDLKIWTKIISKNHNYKNKSFKN